MLRSFARSLSVVIALVGGVAFVGTANAAPEATHKAAKHHHKKAKARKAHHKHARKKAEKPAEPPRPMP